MANSVDEARLILKADAVGFAEARKALATAEANMNSLTAAFQGGAIQQDKYHRKGIIYQNQIDRISDALKTAEAAEKKYGSAQAAAAALADQSQSKLAGFGQSMLQTGRIVQDFTQGGIGGILNNIEGITQALGGGAGLAGVLTVVGTAAFILKPHVVALLESMELFKVDSFTTALDRLHKQIKELEDKPHKVAIDFIELEAARKAVDAINEGLKESERIRQLRTSASQESGQKVNEAIGETPGGADAVQRSVQAQFAREQQATSIALNEAKKKQADAEAKVATLQGEYDQARAKGILGVGEMSRVAPMLNAAKDEVDRLRKLSADARFAITDDDKGTAKAASGALFKQATEGTGDIQKNAQKELARRLRELGNEELAVQVELNTADAVREKRREAVVIDREKRRAALDKALDEKRIAVLEKAGQEAEADAKKQLDEIKKEKEANQRAADAAAAAQGKDADSLAKNLGKGALGRKAIEGGLTLDDVTDAVRKIGGVDKPEAVATDVIDRMQAAATAALQARQAQQGETPERAKESLLNQFDHNARKPDRAAEKREQDRVNRETAEQVKAVAAGPIGQQSQAYAAQLAGQGVDPRQIEAIVAKEIQAELMKRGVNFLRAGSVSGQVAHGAVKDADAALLSNSGRNLAMTAQLARGFAGHEGAIVNLDRRAAELQRTIDILVRQSQSRQRAPIRGNPRS